MAVSFHDQDAGEEGEMTYAELDRRASAVAARLVQVSREEREGGREGWKERGRKETKF